MASQAFKEVKLGFMIGAGLFLFAIVLTIFLALSAKAFAE